MLGITKNIQPTQAVCRCLFGPIDHTEVKKTLGRQLAKIEQDNAERWNFDFQSETPIAGKLTWVKLSEDDSVPIAYKMPGLALFMNLQQMINQRKDSVDPEVSSEIVTTISQPEVSEESERAKPVRASRKRKLSSKQCQITEYFPHKRKMARLEKPLH